VAWAQLLWARVSIKHIDGRQSAFGATAGVRRYTRVGFVTVQVFAPLSEGLGLSKGQIMAIIAKDAFEGKATASGVWFRKVQIKEIGPDDSWYQINVVAEFTYDELK
jgi:hypothetical protein